MPGCWFVLLRFWLRVDRVLVRLYETRIMGNLGNHGQPRTPLVAREVRRSEGTFEQLRSGGAPPIGVGHHLLQHACISMEPAICCAVKVQKDCTAVVDWHASGPAGICCR